MKNILFISLSIFICFTCFVSCDDWTEMEAKVFEKGDGKSDEYYENLRRWKAETDYDMAFGWYGFWSGSGVSLKTSMIGLPDSLHLISVWGPWLPSTVTENKRVDMEHVQKVKGTKVVATVITGWVGTGIMNSSSDYEEKERLYGWEKDWNTVDTWNSPDPQIRARQEEAIRKYARALKDSIFLAGYDGFDIDFEPQYGGAGCKLELADNENFHIMVDELGKYMGPKSGTDKLLVIDGELYNMPGKSTPYFDYFIDQVYSTSTESSLNTRLERLIKVAEGHLSAAEITKKYFVAANFESYSSTGGGTFYQYDEEGNRTTTSRLEGFAQWKPVYNGEVLKKGGYGSYHIEMEYVVANKSGFYPWTRAAIRTVHPPQE